MKAWLAIVGILLIVMSILSFFDWMVEMPVWHGIIVLIVGAISVYIAHAADGSIPEE